MNKFIAAAIQMDSGSNKKENINTAVNMVEEAVKRGAKLIAMPECVNYIGPENNINAEAIPGGYTFTTFSALAKKLNIWIQCGSIYEINDSDSRPYNSSMIINPMGELVAKYHKLHTFDVDIKDGPCVKESDRVCPGNEIVTVDTKEVGNIGLSICYDIRFCEMYRIMALKGAEIFIASSNFTMNTGKDHWETILRTRAIENGCYVIAPGQCGIKPKFQAYGKTVIIDPWGNVIAKASERPCIVMAEIDLDYVQSIRNQVMTIQNRRTDIYNLI